MTPAQGAALVRLARASIRHALGGPGVPPIEEDWCLEPGASFVTLRRKNGDLHGCVGSLEPRRPIAIDVRENAIASALDDPRATALELEDVDDLHVEVSVLSPLERLAFRDESDALAKIAHLRAGVVLRAGPHRATFLPQMWDRLPDAAEFMRQLKRKAGLADDAWPKDVELWHYTVEKFSDT
jgi:hypothetical protein